LSFPDLEKKDGDNVYLVHLRLFWALPNLKDGNF
jgi:hypothetical protein